MAANAVVSAIVEEAKMTYKKMTKADKAKYLKSLDQWEGIVKMNAKDLEEAKDSGNEEKIIDAVEQIQSDFGSNSNSWTQELMEKSVKIHDKYYMTMDEPDKLAAFSRRRKSKLVQMMIR